MDENEDIYKQLKPGTQVFYVPLHAGGDLNHPAVEPGFVVWVNPETEMAYCRYFYTGYGKGLRTRANSEATPVRLLVVKDHRPQHQIDCLMMEIVDGWPG